MDEVSSETRSPEPKLSVYVWQLLKTLGRECAETWRRDLFVSVLLCVVTYFVTRKHDLAARSNLEISLISIGIVFAFYSVFHGIRSIWIVHKDSQRGLNDIGDRYGFVGIAIVFLIAGGIVVCIYRPWGEVAAKNTDTSPLSSETAPPEKPSKNDSPAPSAQPSPNRGPTSSAPAQQPPRPQSTAQQPLPMYQACSPGANCAQSAGQTGGITAGQVNIGAHEWETILDGDRQKTLITALEQARGKVRLTWLFQDIDGMKMAGFLNYAFMQAKWTSDQPKDFAGNVCYPTPQSDCSGLYIGVKDRTSKIARTAIDAIFAFVPDAHVTEDKTVPDDRIDIFVAKAK